MKEMMNSAEVMKQLGISYATFLRRIKDGTIPNVKLGNRLLIPRSFLKTLENQANQCIAEIQE